MGAVVSIVRGEDPNVMVREAIDYVGGLDKIITGSNAFLKPNLGSWVPITFPEYVNRWATTKPEIIVALINELKKEGITDISVGDGAFLDLDADAQFEDSGLKEKIEEVGGKVINLDRDTHEKVKLDNDYTLELASSVLATDNLINIPVLKTHIQTKLTLGLKNLKGVVSKNSKRIMHRGNLERTIALLCKALKPKLTIVDGIVGMEGLGPVVFGQPKKLGLLIVGTDPVAVDAVTARIVGHNPKEIGYLKIASELGLGEINMNNIDIRGLSLEKAKVPFEPAQLGVENIVKQLNIDKINYHGTLPPIGSECTGCGDTFISALMALHDDAQSFQKPVDVVIGSRDFPEQIGDNVLLYGNCQAKNKNKGVWLSGCPPTQRDAYTSLGKMALNKFNFTKALLKRLVKGKKINPLPQWERYKNL